MARLRVPPDFKEFLKLLNTHAVEYLVIGGYAVRVYGYLRATNDLDLWIRTAPGNAQAVDAALRQFGFTVKSLSPDPDIYFGC